MTSSIHLKTINIARVVCAFAIVLLHAATDRAGGAFKGFSDLEQAPAIIIRALSELVSSEFYILLSLFLILMNLRYDHIPYHSFIIRMAKRLIVPFLAWTIIYAFYNLFKASYFGYAHYVWHNLSQIGWWIDAFLLGKGKYHLHFLPTLFLICLFLPIFRIARIWPWIALAILPLLYFKLSASGWIWQNLSHISEVRPYVLRLVKVLSYVGYGLVGGAFLAYLAPQIKTGFNTETQKNLTKLLIFTLVCLVLVKLAYAYMVVGADKFVHRSGLIFYAHALGPITLFGLFLSLEGRITPPFWAKFAIYGYGIYLVHPLFIDAAEVVSKSWDLQPITLLLWKFGCAAIGALSLTIVLGRFRMTRWLVGVDQRQKMKSGAPI